jgi:hypothetical protein
MTATTVAPSARIALVLREGYSKTRSRPALHAEPQPFVEPELCIARVIADE